MVPCKKCGKPTILATGTVFEFNPDPEPYEADEVIEGMETIYPHEDVMIGIYYCEHCKEINDIWIENPQQEEKNQRLTRLMAERDG
jgi:hypothetical protein